MEYCSSYKGANYWYMQHHKWLKSIMLCEGSQVQKTTYYMIHLYDIWKRENYRDRNLISICWMAEGRGGRKALFLFLFFVIEIICILVFAMVKIFVMINYISLSKFIELYTLKEWILLYLNYTSINFLKILKVLGRAYFLGKSGNIWSCMFFVALKNLHTSFLYLRSLFHPPPLPPTSH